MSEPAVGDWESIVREHGPMAFETAWRLVGHRQDAEDAVQEALLDAHRLYTKGHVRNWGGLLRHLCTRRALDCLRRRRPELPIESEPLSSANDEPENQAEARELAHRLRSAIAELPDRQAAVFSLRYFGEMSNAEIAETLKIRIQAVAVALHRARVMLAQKLELSNARLPGVTDVPSSRIQRRKSQ